MQWPGNQNQPGIYQQEFGGGPAPQYYNTSGSVGGAFRTDPRFGMQQLPPAMTQQQWSTAPPPPQQQQHWQQQQQQQQQWSTDTSAREGFSIRRVEMRRSDSGLPWGFRLKGGADVGAPFVIESIEPHGFAHRAGLRIGDRVLLINGSSTRNMRHEDLKTEIIRGGDALEMVVERLADASESAVAPPTAALPPDAASYSQSTSMPSHYPPQKQQPPPPSNYSTPPNPMQYSAPNQSSQPPPHYAAMAPPQPVAAPPNVYPQMPQMQPQTGFYNPTMQTPFPRVQVQYYPPTQTQPQAPQLQPQYGAPPQNYFGAQAAYEWQQQPQQQQPRPHDDSYYQQPANQGAWSTPQMQHRPQGQQHQVGAPPQGPPPPHQQMMPPPQQWGVPEGWPQQTDAGASAGGSPYTRPQSKAMGDSLITYESSPQSDPGAWAPDFTRRLEPPDTQLRAAPQQQRSSSPMYPMSSRPVAPPQQQQMGSPAVQSRPFVPTPPPPKQQPMRASGVAPGPGPGPVPSLGAGVGAGPVAGPGLGLGTGVVVGLGAGAGVGAVAGAGAGAGAGAVPRRQRRADRSVPPPGDIAPLPPPVTTNEGMWMTSGPPAPLVPPPAGNPVALQEAHMPPLPAEPALEFKSTDGHVKRVVQPSYNTPIGLYSSDNVHEALVKTMKNVNAPIAQESPEAKPTSPVQQRRSIGHIVPPIWPPPARIGHSYAPVPISIPIQQPPPPAAPLRPPQLLAVRARGPAPGMQRTQSHDSVVRCAVCSFGIRGVFVRAGPTQSPVHAECFKCARCDTNLRGRSYCFLDGCIYCDAHAKQVRRDAPLARADEGPIRSF